LRQFIQSQKRGAKKTKKKKKKKKLGEIQRTRSHPAGLSVAPQDFTGESRASRDAEVPKPTLGMTARPIVRRLTQRPARY